MPLPWEEELLRRVQRFEGFSARPYGDYKQTSVGFGTRYRPGQDTSRESLEGDLRRELQRATSQVRGRFPNVPEDRVGPLSSFTYNVGPGWMDKSPRLRGAVEAGDWDAAGRVMQEYNRAGGQVLPGLQRRRAAEAEGLRQGWGKAQAQELPQAPLGAPAIAGNTFGTPAGWEGQRMSLGAMPAASGPGGGIMDIIKGILGGGPAAARAPAAAPEQFGPPASMMAPPMEAPQTPPPEPQMPAPPPDMPAFPPLHDPSAFPQQPEPPPGIAMTPQTPRLPGVQVPPVPPATDTAAAPTVQPAPPGWGPQGAPPGVERRGPPGGMAPQRGGGGLYDYFSGGMQGGGRGLMDALNAGLASRGLNMALPLAFGQAGAQSAAAGQGAHELALRELAGGREHLKFGQEQEAYQARRRAWEGAFPGGQGDPNNPLFRGLPPELIPGIQGLGPDQGMKALLEFQMGDATKRADMAREMDRMRLIQQMEEGGGAAPTQAQPAPSAPAAAPTGSFGGAGIGGAMPGVDYTPPPALAPQITSPGAQPAAPRPSAPSQATAPAEPMVQIGGQQMTIPEARRRMDIRGKFKQDTSALKGAIDDAEKQAAEIRKAGEPTPDMRNKAATVEKAFNNVSASLDRYNNLIQKGRATEVGLFRTADRESAMREYNNVLLEMKELFNLGALSEKDISLTTFLPDPTLSLVPGLGQTGFNIPGPNIKANTERAVTDVKEILRTKRNSAAEDVGKAPLPPPPPRGEEKIKTEAKPTDIRKMPDGSTRYFINGQWVKKVRDKDRD